MKKLFAFIAISLSCAAHATTYTGTVLEVLSNSSQTTAGNTRVSIHTGSTTSCTALPGWYSYDMPSASVGALWSATLLTALATGKAVTINGTGTCDAFGLEIVSSIGALP